MSSLSIQIIDLAIIALVIIIISVSAVFFSIARTLQKTDRVEADKNYARAGRRRINLVLGHMRTKNDFLVDNRVHEGMVFNKDDNRIEVNGGLSAEAARRTFGIK